MKWFRKIPGYTILLAVFFCLHAVAQNPFGLTAGDVISAGLPVIAGIAVVFFTCFFLLHKNLLLAGFTTFFFCAWYLFTGAIEDRLKNIPILHNFFVFTPILIAITIFLTVRLKAQRILLSRLTVFLNLLLLIYCAADGLSILRSRVWTKNKISQSERFEISRVSQKPDVYFLLFDAYAGYASLRDSFGFPNNSLRTELDGMGFHVLPSFSNYTITPLSMSSILNMEYAAGLQDSIVRIADIQQSIYKIRDAAVFQNFEKMGYGINNFSIFDIEGQKNSGGGSFFPMHEPLLTNKFFHYRLLKNIAQAEVNEKHFSKFVRQFFLRDLPGYNDRTGNNLLAFSRLNHNAPQFVYAHFLMPHYPTFRDSSGNELSDSLLFETTKPEQAKLLYLSYLKYCNTKIVQYSAEIIRNHPGAIIIIMSDHGYRRFDRFFQPSYTDNICELRTPGKQAVAPGAGISAVNFFRHFFNDQFNQRYPILKDSVFVIRE